MRQARAAAAVFSQFTQEDVDRIVKPMVLAGLEQAQYLARLAVEETKIGVMEDKAIKNMVATEFVYNYVKDKKTVGVIREYPERSLVEVAEPIGVIFSMTPITNPTSTVLFKCIMAIKTRNAVIFSPHPTRGEVLLRGGADHVRDRGETRRTRRCVHLPARAHAGRQQVPDAPQGHRPDRRDRRPGRGEGGLQFRQTGAGRGRGQHSGVPGEVG